MSLDWHCVETEADVERLLSAFGGFHDGCLREVHIWTETWVGEDMIMSCPSRLDAHVRILFQRQSRSPSAIELLFEQVTGFHFVPTPKNADPSMGDQLRYGPAPLEPG